MAQVKLLKIATDGVPLEFSSVDDITLNSFTAGSGPVMSPTGIDMNGQDVTDLSDLVFTDPAVGTVNQTAGALIVNNIMAKERDNVMASGSAILFGSIADVAAQLDAFQIPQSSALPTATPANNANEGYFVGFGGKPYYWTGSAWDDLTTTASAESVQNNYIADEALAARDTLYISAADNVSKADVSGSGAPSRVVGLAVAAAIDTAVVAVQSEGLLAGFSGLTAGARYYGNPAAAGGITATRPVGAGNTIVQIGYAKSATVLHIHIEQMGRLS
jgi:hypothetical protein